MYNTGKVKTNLQYAVNLESMGFYSFHTRCAFDLMGQLIRAGAEPDRMDVPSGALIAPIDWNIVTSRIKVASLSSMASQETTSETTPTQDLASRIRDLDANAAQSEVQMSLCKAISEVIGTKPDYDIHIFLPLHELFLHSYPRG